MANFDACKAFPQGYDDANYKLTIPAGWARFIALYGGGPGGVALNVQWRPDLIELRELTFDKDVNKNGANFRVFRLFGLKGGSNTELAALVPGGGAYSKPLAIEITADADGTLGKLKNAFDESRKTLRDALTKLRALADGLRNGSAGRVFSLNDDQKKTLALVNKWMKTPDITGIGGVELAPGEMTKVTENYVVTTSMAGLVEKNLNLKTSAGKEPSVMRTQRGGYGLAYPKSPDFGLELCEACFTPGGPLCRRDVVTHEFFHLIGVGHGEGPKDKPLPYASRTINYTKALNSADHLAQFVAELTSAKFDCCGRNE